MSRGQRNKSPRPLISVNIFMTFKIMKTNHSGRAVRNVIGLSTTVIVGSNPTRGMDVFPHLFCYPVWVAAFRQGRSPVQSILSTVYKIQIS
jgi:hypothetical protein